jgi:superfamily II DNA or RNA helicase
MEILKAGKELENVEKAAKKATKEVEQQGVPQTPFTIDTTDAVDAQVVADFRDEVAVRAVRSLLGKVEKEDGLTRHIRTGAFDTLNEAALTVAGSEVISRDLLDFVGSAGAARVLAGRMRANLSDEEFKTTAEAVEALHSKTNAEIAQGAVKEAEAHLDAAKQIVLDSVENPVDIAAARQLNEQRLDHIEQARKILGDAFGRLTALGELSLALKDAPKKGQPITVDLGAATRAQAATMARAFGLTPETGDVAEGEGRDFVDKGKIGAAGEPDYTIESGGGHTMIHLAPAALNKLSTPFDQADKAITERAVAIKSGKEDEDGWLPAGIERRPTTTFQDPDYQVARFDNTLDKSTMESGNLRERLEDYIGAQVAEGYDMDDLRADFYDPSFMDTHFPRSLWGEYEAHRAELLPMASLTKEERGFRDETDKTKYQTSKEGVSATEAARLLSQRNEQIRAESLQKAQAFSRRYKEKHGLTDEDLVELNTQRIPITEEQTAEAVHRTLAAVPHARAAFAPLGKLTHEDQATIRDFYVRKVAGIKEQAPTETGDAKKPAPNTQHPTPNTDEAEGGFDFGDEELEKPAATKMDDTTAEWLKARGYTPEQIQEENRQRGAAEREAAAKTEASAGGESPEAAGSPESEAWTTFVSAMGGQQRAYETVQGILRGEAANEYAKNHGQVFGKPLKVGKQRVPNWESYMIASLPPEKLKAALGHRAEEAQRLLAQVASRSSGKFAKEGGEGARVQALAKLKEMIRSSQLGMLGSETGPAVSMQRPTIGADAEKQLGSVWGKYAQAFAKGKGVSLIPDLSMSGGKVKQQRAVKLALHQRRLGLHLGAGSGKSLTSIGTFTELHHQGKATKAVFAVPSAVLGQFGSEMLRYTTPGKYKWLADPSASREDRFAAYKRGSGTHMIVCTHQALRGDVIHAMALHRGEDPKATLAWFKGQDKGTQRRAVKAAMEHHGWDIDFSAVDEAHTLLNRAGKANSTMADAIDGLTHHMPTHLSMTGTPVKNDPSEAFDMLSKLDPERFTDRKAFMAKYGIDAQASKDSLQRLMQRYVYADRIASGVHRNSEVRELDLTPEQQRAMTDLEGAYRQAKRATKAGQVDVEAARKLSPDRFEGKDAGEHEAIAREMGEKGHAAYLQNRRREIVNDFDYEHNAKIHALREDMTKDKDKPHVIFAHNYKSIGNIKRLCAELGMSVGVVSGKKTAQEKMAARLGFQPDGEGDPKYHVLVCTDAGAVGQNLQRGQVLVNYDTPDTAMLHEQRIARIDRIGQQNDVTVRDYTTKTKYERAARRRLARKYALADVFQSPSDNLDDTGLAAEIQRVRAERRDKAAARQATKRSGGVRQQDNMEALRAKWAAKEKERPAAAPPEPPPAVTKALRLVLPVKEAHRA